VLRVLLNQLVALAAYGRIRGLARLSVRRVVCGRGWVGSFIHRLSTGIAAPAQAKPQGTRAVNSPTGPVASSPHKGNAHSAPKSVASKTTPSNQYSAIGCGKSQISESRKNCQDIEISNNHFGGVNSVFENEGKADRILISGANVAPSKNGSATVVRNLPGGEAGNITIQDPKVGYDGGAAARPSGDWLSFRASLNEHRDAVPEIVAHWTAKLEKMWSKLPEDEKKRNQLELSAMKEKLLSAASDSDSFSKLLKELQTNPPHFKMPD